MGDAGEDRSQINTFPQDKTAAILADDVFKYIFYEDDDFFQISLKLVPRSSIDNGTALV